MNELMKNTIVKVVPVINFSDYETLKSQAIELARHINTVEVTEENVKVTKKMLARVNASIKDLNTRRIAIKNEILEPYNAFAEQIKEIESIVRDADTIVRNQVREIEEKERQEKKKDLESIWNARITGYEHSRVIHFNDWIEPKHLNKTSAVSKSEIEMIAFLEQCERDLEVLSKMEDSKELIYEYTLNFNLAMTIRNIEQKKKILSEQKEVRDEVAESRYVFIVTGEKDRKLTEILLNEHEIEYELKEY